MLNLFYQEAGRTGNLRLPSIIFIYDLGMTAGCRPSSCLPATSSRLGRTPNKIHEGLSSVEDVMEPANC